VGPQNRSQRREEEKILDPTGIQTPSPLVQSVASPYTPILFVCLSIYLSIYGSTVLLFGPWPLFQFLNSIYSRKDSLGGRSARRKAATYMQDSTNTE
jgi:hypothetical protein